MLNSILIHLDDSPECWQRLQYAHMLAKQLKAELHGVYVEPVADMPVTAGPASVPLHPEMVRPATAEDMSEKRSRIQKMVDDFRKIYPLRWESIKGETGRILATESYYHDLLVVSRNLQANDLDWTHFLSNSIIDIASNSATSVLVLPVDRLPEKPVKNPAIVWEPTRECARAAREATPLLNQAGQVTVLNKIDDALFREQSESPETLIRLFSQRGVHDDRIEVKNFHKKDVDTMVDKLNKSNHDLLVVGVYGHKHLRELFLRSTSHELAKQAEIPLLLAH